MTRSRHLFKVFARLLGLCAGLGLPGVAAAQDQFRVAVVDVAKVFGGYYKTREVDKMVAETRAAAQQQMDARLEKHHQLLEEIARLAKGLDDPALSVPARADRQKQHDDKVQELHAMEQENRESRANQDRNLQELTIRLRNQIVEDILAVVRTQVERRHYDLVLNKSAQGSRSRNVVLYANPDLEISDEVIAALNHDHPAGVQGTPTASPEP